MAQADFETRTRVAELELRDDSTTGAPTLEGYAATFDQPYDLGPFTERIHPDAFKRTLENGADVRLLIDHQGQPLARTKSGTLTLRTVGDDGKPLPGLQARATLDPSDPDVQRLLPKMRRGDLDQMSFAFRVPRGGDDWGDDGIRTIREANLSGGDVSVVTYPANPATSVQVRAEDLAEAQAVFAEAMWRELRSGTISAGNMARLRSVLSDWGVLNASEPGEALLSVPAQPSGMSLGSARRLAAALDL